MIQDKLLQATFKGAAFYWRSLSTQVGKKTVSHTYPGSSRRFVEDMGRLPKIFTIEAMIAGGKAYNTNKMALENALSSPGAGWLVHPTYGRVLCSAKPATCKEDLKKLGQAQYTLTFERAYEEARPQVESVTTRSVERLSELSLNEVSEAAASQYRIPQSPSFFNQGVAQIQEFSDSLARVTESVSSVRQEANTLSSKITALKNNAVDLVTQPIGLFNDIKGIYEELVNMDDFLTDQFNRLTNLFGQSSSAPPGGVATSGQRIPPISYESENAENNRVIFNEVNNINALVQAQRTIGKIEFTDQQTLDEAQKRVEDQFENILDSKLMKEPLRDKIIEARDISNKIVSEKRLSASKIVTTKLRAPRPLNVVLFEHTGSITNNDYIQGLNPDQSQTFAKGSVKVLE